MSKRMALISLAVLVVVEVRRDQHSLLVTQQQVVQVHFQQYWGDPIIGVEEVVVRHIVLLLVVVAALVVVVVVRIQLPPQLAWVEKNRSIGVKTDHRMVMVLQREVVTVGLGLVAVEVAAFTHKATVVLAVVVL